MFLLILALFRVSLLCDVWCHFRIMLVSFWYHFGVLLDSFWYHFGALGRHLATLGTPGDPHGSRVEKVMKKLVRGSFVGPPLGHLLEPKSVTNPKKNCCENHIEKHCAQSAAKEVPGDPLKP